MRWPSIDRAVEKLVAAVIEKRGYADLILAGLEATVEGSTANVLQTAALETAAGIWARALAASTVTGTDALTRRVRHLIGRELIRAGEVVLVIEVVDGLVQLVPAASFEVLAGWEYRVEVIAPPGGSISSIVPSDGVLHPMWAVDPREAWRGISPMGAASLGGKLAAQVESKLIEEASTPTAHILPVPADGGATNLTQLRTDIGGAKGKAVLAESTHAGWNDGKPSGTREDWKAQRLGPEIPDGLRALYGDILDRVLGACGIPAALAAADADGTAQREAYRRFVMSAVEPVAEVIAEEASAKLDAEVGFDFAQLHAHDIQGRASAYERLRRAEMPDADARRLTGLG